MATNPNFPADLDIRPLISLGHTASNDDCKFSASAQEDTIREYGIAGRVWEAAYVMKAYLAPSVDHVYDPAFLSQPHRGSLRVLELGSGTGVVAAQMARQLRITDDVMIVTDLPEVCSLLETNLQQHIVSQDHDPVVLIRPLTWGDRTHALSICHELRSLLTSGPLLSHIVCSDLVYFPELLAPLLRSLLHLTSPPFVHYDTIAESAQDSPKVVISYKVRSLTKETSFWSAFGLWFIFEPVLERRKSANVASLGRDLFIFVAQRRAESMTWEVPEADEDLLGGVGAWGNSARKGDGTLETLLLMSMDVDD